MALSDEDRAAIFALRCHLEDKNPFCKTEHWERVLKLAGEEPPEPADLTFWFDPDDPDVWMRDDKAVLMVHGPGDLRRWYRTGDDRNFSWEHVYRQAPNLVELVRADAGDMKYQTVLMELWDAWEAWHQSNCGDRVPLSECVYHECLHRWSELLRYGLDGKMERS